MFGAKGRKDNRGLSLVELICALAILGVITSTVGGAMAVATNSYRRGSVETALQQEAQFTTNHIESLIIDATKEVKWKTSTDEATGAVTKELIIVNDDKAYRISFDPASEELRYSEHNASKADDVAAANAISDAYNLLLAEHVSDFSADTSGFEEARTVLLKLVMKNGSSEYTSSYNITSRNNPNLGDPLVVTASLKCEPDVYIEPDHDFVLYVTIMGASGTLKAEMEPDDDAEGVDLPTSDITSNGESTDKNPYSTASTATVADGSVKIYLDTNETGGDDQARLVKVWLEGGDGSTIATTYVTAHVRRIREIKISDRLVSTDKQKGEAGSVYELTVADDGFNYKANRDLNNLDRQESMSDKLTGYEYVNPRQVRWEVAPGATDYVNFLTDQVSNTVQFELLEDINPGEQVDLVKAVSLHAEGVHNGVKYNKPNAAYGGVGYDDVYSIFTIKMPRSADSGIMRGKMALMYPHGTEGGSSLEWLRANVTPWEPNTTIWVENMRKITAYYRVYSVDGTDQSEGFSDGTWYNCAPTDRSLHTENGDSFRFAANCFTADGITPTYYMKDYKLQVLYCYNYLVKVYDSNGSVLRTETRWWPEFLNDADSPLPYINDQNDPVPATITNYHTAKDIDTDTEGDYLMAYDLERVSLDFKGVGTGFSLVNETWNPYSYGGISISNAESVVVTADGEGLGTFSQPIPINNHGSQWTFNKILVGMRGGTAIDPNVFDRAAGNMLSNSTIYDLTDGTTHTGGWIFQDDGNGIRSVEPSQGAKNFSILETQSAGNHLVNGHVYKLVLGNFQGRGTETYTDESTGRGVIYFKYAY